VLLSANVVAVLLFAGLIAYYYYIRHNAVLALFDLQRLDSCATVKARKFLLTLDCSPFFALFLVLIFLSTHPVWRLRDGAELNTRRLIASFAAMVFSLLFLILLSACRLTYLLSSE
jgi:hypothetical protein